MVGWHHRLSGRELEHASGGDSWKPAWLQYMGLRRAGDNSVTEQAAVSIIPQSSRVLKLDHHFVSLMYVNIMHMYYTCTTKMLIGR